MIVEFLHNLIFYVVTDLSCLCALVPFHNALKILKHKSLFTHLFSRHLKSPGSCSE